MSQTKWLRVSQRTTSRLTGSNSRQPICMWPTLVRKWGMQIVVSISFLFWLLKHESMAKLHGDGDNIWQDMRVTVSGRPQTTPFCVKDRTFTRQWVLWQGIEVVIIVTSIRDTHNDQSRAHHSSHTCPTRVWFLPNSCLLSSFLSPVPRTTRQR